jgi:hypothetical protein
MHVADRKVLIGDSDFDVRLCLFRYIMEVQANDADRDHANGGVFAF